MRSGKTMSSTEFNLQVFLEAIHGLHPATLTSEQLGRAISAIRFALPRFEAELRRRDMAEAQRSEFLESTRAMAETIMEGV